MVESCRTCELLARRDAGEGPLWDCIVRTPAWDIVHCDDTAVEGWLVLVVRRHLTTVADLSDEEAGALGPLIRDVSRALRDVTGCAKTYVVQFAEHPRHPHVHVHVIPRRVDLPAGHIGPGIFTQLAVGADRRVSEARMDELAAGLRARLGPQGAS